MATDSRLPAMPGQPGRRRPAQLLREHRLPWETLPATALQDNGIWRALLDYMPMTALLRNLAALTRKEIIAGGSETTRSVAARISDPERLRRATIHPITALSALHTYLKGYSERSKQTWPPIEAMGKTNRLPLGGTDCALPMLDARQAVNLLDCFVILTDNETWAGDIHPAEALRQYRERTGIPARLVVVAMMSNGFGIADPQDAGMLDIVGLDANAPRLIADFAGGRIGGQTAAAPALTCGDNPAGLPRQW